MSLVVLRQGIYLTIQRLNCRFSKLIRATIQLDAQCKRQLSQPHDEMDVIGRRFLVRQAGAFEERQMRIRLAPLWKSANQLLSTHFKNTGGIQATPVFDGKNARVCITAKLSGFTMLLLKVVMELGVHVFKVHEEAELPGISEEDLQELASKAQSDIVVQSAPLLIRLCFSFLAL